MELQERARRAAIGVVAAVTASCMIPQQSSVPPPPPGQAPAQSYPQAQAAAPSYGPCEYACGQISRCQLAPYETCVTTCRQEGSEQEPGGAEQLHAVSRMSCEELVAAFGSESGSSEPAEPASEDLSEETIASAPPASAAVAGGRWVSADHASYTNAAYTSADFYLEVMIAGDGSFRGSWARYICLVQTYGIWSCGKGDREGSASGQLAADGSGSISLERLGRSSLTWTSRSHGEIALELPQGWQGERVLYRSTIKR
jgi:hypothetical protein